VPDLFDAAPAAVQSTATLSPCGLYRYDLTRSWDRARPRALFVMLNPSTADATQDDPTIRRCVGFARAWGCGGIVVCNLFALRSTDPKALYRHADPVGPDNDATLLDRAAMAKLTVCAWGAHGHLRGRGRTVAKLLAAAKMPMHCLGLTKTGHPLHPLFVPGATALQEFGGVYA
jgi:hypothetical protein